MNGVLLIIYLAKLSVYIILEKEAAFTILIN